VNGTQIPAYSVIDCTNDQVGPGTERQDGSHTASVWPSQLRMRERWRNQLRNQYHAVDGAEGPGRRGPV